MDKYLKTVTKDCTDTLKLLADVTSFIETYIDQKGAKRLLSKLNTQQKALEDLNDMDTSELKMKKKTKKTTRKQPVYNIKPKYQKFLGATEAKRGETVKLFFEKLKEYDVDHESVSTTSKTGKEHKTNKYMLDEDDDNHKKIMDLFLDKDTTEFLQTEVMGFIGKSIGEKLEYEDTTSTASTASSDKD